MAYTKIHPIHKTVDRAIRYITNPEKTQSQQLVSGYNCVPDSAALEFLWTQDQAQTMHRVGRRAPNGPQAYHLIQSFSPNDGVTPEQAQQLGKALAAELLGGEFQYVLATHVDQAHIHNHIVFCATSWLTYQKFRSKPYRTAAHIREISDRLCAEQNLSVIQNPSPLKHSYTEWLARRSGTSWRAELRKRLNFVLSRATSYDQFLRMCRELELTVDDSRADLRYRLEGQPGGKKRWNRGSRLSDEETFTRKGVLARVEENDRLRKQLCRGVESQAGPAQDWKDFCQRLESEHGICLTQGKRGLIVRFPGGETRKEEVLGPAFSRARLERAVLTSEFSLDESSTPSVGEQWEQARRGRGKESSHTPVTLRPENVEKRTVDGLLLRLEVGEEPFRLFLDSKQIDFDPETQTYTAWIHPAYRYYAVSGTLNPDWPESDQLTERSLGGETIIRQLDRQNGTVGQWVEVPPQVIRSAGPNGISLSLQELGVEQVWIDQEDSQITPDWCRIRIYDHWSYGQQVRGRELRPYLEQMPERGTQEQIWRRYRVYERRGQRKWAQQLSQTLRTMEREDIRDQSFFSLRRTELQAKRNGWKDRVKALTLR